MDQIERLKNWIQTKEGMVFSTLIFFPIGIYFLIKSKNIKPWIKAVGSVVAIIYFLNFVSLSSNSSSVLASNENLNGEITSLKASVAEKDQQISSYKEVEAEYATYKSEMKPYEALSEADAKKKQADAEAAEKVNGKISSLPETDTVTVEDKKDVDSAQKLYDSLTDSQKELVNVTKLSELKDKIGSLEAEAKEAAEKKKAEEEAAAAAKKKQEEEEARGYDTGITYDQLARTPDDYELKKVKFYGRVIQVLEGDGVTQIRLAVDDNYDTVLYGEYNSSIVSSRVLEDDFITISGISMGLLSYESTMGGTITIPSISIDKIDGK